MWHVEKKHLQVLCPEVEEACYSQNPEKFKKTKLS